jgi:hypothetical protein
VAYDVDMIMKVLLDIRQDIGELKAQQQSANLTLQRHFDDDKAYQLKIDQELEDIVKNQEQQKGAIKAYGAVAAGAGVIAGAVTSLMRTHL